MRPRPGYVLLGVAAAVAALVLVPRPGVDAAAAPVVRDVPVEDVTLVCAQAPGRGTNAFTLVSASAPGTTGTMTVRPLAGANAAPLARLDGAGSTLTYIPGAGKSGPVLVRGTGERARGATATVFTRVESGPRRSISTAACTQPTGETWLAGGSTVAGRRDVVYLTNADAAPAVVDVTVYGPQGASSPESAQGVTVAPSTQVALALDALAPGIPSTVVAVHARSGRVAAALVDAAATGSVPAGVDWVPPTWAPTRHAVVVGIPADADARRRLVLLVPGQQDAQVTVRLATPEGTLSPPDLNALAVPGGRVLTVDLAKAGTTDPYAVLVDSDQPIVAGVWTQRGGAGQLHDFAYAAAAEPVVGDAVMLPRVVRTPAVATTLQLTAPEHDVVVRVTLVSPSGTTRPPVDVTVPGGRMVQVPVGVPGPDSSVRVEAPAGSGLVVGWVYSEQGQRGPLVTAGPLLQTPLSTPLPPVTADPAVGFPGH